MSIQGDIDYIFLKFFKNRDEAFFIQLHNCSCCSDVYSVVVFFIFSYFCWVLFWVLCCLYCLSQKKFERDLEVLISIFLKTPQLYHSLNDLIRPCFCYDHFFFRCIFRLLVILIIYFGNTCIFINPACI